MKLIKFIVFPFLIIYLLITVPIAIVLGYMRIGFNVLKEWKNSIGARTKQQERDDWDLALGIKKRTGARIEK